MEKNIDLYYRGDEFLIQGTGQIGPRKETLGTTICYGPVYKSSRTDPNLGIIVLDLLQQEIFDLPQPGRLDWPSVQKPILTAACVKSWLGLTRKYKHLVIFHSGDLVRVGYNIPGVGEPECEEYARYTELVADKIRNCILEVIDSTPPDAKLPKY